MMLLAMNYLGSSLSNYANFGMKEGDASIMGIIKRYHNIRQLNATHFSVEVVRNIWLGIVHTLKG